MFPYATAGCVFRNPGHRFGNRGQGFSNLGTGIPLIADSRGGWFRRRRSGNVLLKLEFERGNAETEQANGPL